MASSWERVREVNNSLRDIVTELAVVEAKIRRLKTDEQHAGIVWSHTQDYIQQPAANEDMQGYTFSCEKASNSLGSLANILSAFDTENVNLRQVAATAS